MQSRGELPSLENEDRMLERPFYFIVVLWGKRFRDYFLDLCLPTLLSSRNLPALKTRQRSRFLFCTRPEDWAEIKGSAVFQPLEHYVDPVYIEIPPCPPGVSSCVHMGIGHRRGCELAYEAKAYPFVLTPDCIFGDGTIARLQELALGGVQLALVPALRFAEEPLFEQLQQTGISPHGAVGRAAPITISNRDLARMALASLHSETKTYEWDAPYFHRLPSAVWWRVPGEDGILVHCLSWAPLLFDFTAVPEHDTSVFDEWTFDGDYIYNNLGDIKRIHLVLDSDEIFIASWAPLSDKPYDLKPRQLLKTRLLGSFLKKQRFNAAFYSDVFDPLKREVFFEPARWHSKPLNESWACVETRALMTLLSCVFPPLGARKVLLKLIRNRQLSKFALYLLELRLRLFQWRVHCMRLVNRPLSRLLFVLRSLWTGREKIVRRTYEVIQGDRLAWKQVTWRFRQAIHLLLGRRFSEPEPAALHSLRGITESGSPSDQKERPDKKKYADRTW
jgi:hypothetical protein